jgi:hypothetical protein
MSPDKYEGLQRFTSCFQTSRVAQTLNCKKRGNDDVTHPPSIKTQNSGSRAASTHAWPAAPLMCICIFDQRLTRYHHFYHASSVIPVVVFAYEAKAANRLSLSQP